MKNRRGIPDRPKGRMSERRSPDRTDSGDTLVEILIALVVISLTAGSILGAFATSISATSEQRTLATSDSVLRSFVEAATFDIRLSPPVAATANLPALPAFQSCPSGIPSQYSEIASYFSNHNAPTGYTLSISAVTNMATACVSSKPSPQVITAKVASTSGANDTMSFVASQPDATPASITTAITSLSPTNGPAAGLTAVTITGEGFTGATSVHFGTTSATFVPVSNTTVIATSPAGTGTVSVTVTTPAGTSATNGTRTSRMAQQ